MADEITNTAPLVTTSKWILQNTPHPDGRCGGLRIIIVLPSSDFEDNSHYGEMHWATHLAVTKAWLSAGKSTLIWLSGLHYSRDPLRVVPTGVAKRLAAVNPDGVNGLFRGSRHVVFSPAWEPGKVPAIYDRPFHASIAETLTMLLGWLMARSKPRRYDLRRGKAAKYWRAVMDTWRRGDSKPACLSSALTIIRNWRRARSTGPPIGSTVATAMTSAPRQAALGGR